MTYAVAGHSASERSAGREPEREREPEPEPEPSSTRVVFVVDESLDEDEAESLRASPSTRRAPPAGRADGAGLIRRRRRRAEIDLALRRRGASSPLHASAEIVPGTRSPTPEDVAGIVGEARPAGIAARFLASAADGGEDRLDAALASLRRPFARDSAASRVPARERPRCLGAAIETAAMLLPDGGRLVVCAGGPPTRGPGGVRGRRVRTGRVPEARGGGVFRPTRRRGTRTQAERAPPDREKRFSFFFHPPSRAPHRSRRAR